MSSSGFNKTQLTQLESLFDKNNKQTAEHMESLFDKNNKQTAEYMTHVVSSLSETIENTKRELLKRMESMESSLEGKIYTVNTELRDEIQNLSLTMSTKYDMENLQKRVKALEKAQITS